MAKRIGFMQTGGIGDLIMILPIADHYEERGWEVVWPIDPRYLAMFQRAKPSISFLPVEGSPADRRPFYLDRPLELINLHGCEKTIIFYINIFGLNICDTRLSNSLKFDEYKYAIAGVPFARKWQLKYERDMEREQKLFDSLNIVGEYVCVHEKGSDVQLPMPFPAGIEEGFRVIRVDEKTDSVFDWRLTLERASHLFLIDSCFANLVDQIGLTVKKSLLLRSLAAVSPVYRGDWKFIYADPMNLVSDHNKWQNE